MSNMQPPCKGCKDRWVTSQSRCHSTCERYIAYNNARTEMKDAIFAEKKKNNNISQAVLLGVKRMSGKSYYSKKGFA